jgi:hypothetical protein
MGRIQIGVRVVFVAVALWMIVVAPTSSVASATPGFAQPPLGPQVGQSCDDPLRLAYDSSGQAVVCTRAGSWVQSVMPTTVRLLGAPCSPNDPVAKTPDDHLIGCQSGLWTLYHP